MITHGPAPWGWGPLPNTTKNTASQDPRIIPFSQWPPEAQARITATAPDAVLFLHSLDFIGFGQYGTPVNPSVTIQGDASHLEVPSTTYNITCLLEAELVVLGFDLRGWLAQGGKMLVWGEVGIGGGLSRCGDVPARIAWEAGIFPSLGVTTPFDPKLNPWGNPAAEETKGSNGSKDMYLLGGKVVTTPTDMRRLYYDAVLGALAVGEAGYPVGGAFIWSLASWDVQGIHPASKGREGGSYADEYIIHRIKEHNNVQT